MEDKKTKLVSFEANNILCFRFAECEFGEDGQLIKIGGQNGAGKSCFLDVLNFLFYGKKGVDKPDVLRWGADKGYAKAILGGNEYTLRRSINKSGGEVFTVRDADGKPIKSPQSFIDSLVGQVSIDPSVLWKMTDKEIAEKLRDVMGIKLDDLDANEKELGEQRKDQKKLVQKTQVELDNLEFYPGYPNEPTSIADLAKELERANDNNSKIKNIENELRQAEGQVLAIDEEIQSLKAKIFHLENDQKSQWEKAVGLKEKLDESEEVDTQVITTRMSTIEAENQKIAANKQHELLEQKIEEDKTVVEKLNTKIEEIRQERRERIAAAEFPLDGVGFDVDGNFVMDGRQWNSYSDGERLFAAFELSVAMNPSLECVLIRNGAWIDDVGRRDIAEIAKERKYLVLMEVVGEHDVQIVMEDGQMKDLRGE